MVSKELLGFLKDNKDLIADNNFEELFKKLESTSISGQYSKIRSQELTELFRSSGIDFLRYVKTVPQGSFMNLDIDSIEIPGNIKNIDSAAFEVCTKLKSVEFNEGLKYIDNSAFRYCQSLVGVRLPKGLVSVGIESFGGCINLKTVKFPNSISLINNLAFEGCYSLNTVVIPNKTVTFGNRVFNKCNHVTILTYKGSNAEKYAKDNHIGIDYL